MEKRSGDPLRIFVLLYREHVRLSSPQRGKKSLVQRTFFRDFIKTAHRGCGAQYSLSKNLVEFAPAGAKKVRLFSSATCAAKKIPLGLQTCAPSASGGQRVRCRQAASLFVKKYHFLTGAAAHRGCGAQIDHGLRILSFSSIRGRYSMYGVPLAQVKHASELNASTSLCDCSMGRSVPAPAMQPPGQAMPSSR